MKYGLREKKEFWENEDFYDWKVLVENEIKNLRLEVALGKQQLKELNEKLRKNSKVHTCACEFTGKNSHCLPAGGTMHSRFKVFTCEPEVKNGPMLRLECIPFMKEYQNWSLEELRLADYKIANLPQRCEFIETGPNWPYPDTGTSCDPELTSNYQNNYLPKSSEISPEHENFDKTARKSHSEDSKVIQKYEELLEKVVSELKTVNKNIKSVDSKLSALEDNVASLNVEVSVLDSRLHSVDMFVTMENFEKKWQTFKPRLNSLGSTPARNVEEVLDEKGDCSSYIKFTPVEGNSAELKLALSTPVSKVSVKEDTLSLNKENIVLNGSSSHQALIFSTPTLSKKDASENPNKLWDSPNVIDASTLAQSTLLHKKNMESYGASSHLPLTFSTPTLREKNESENSSKLCESPNVIDESTSAQSKSSKLIATNKNETKSQNKSFNLVEMIPKADSETSLTNAVTNFYCDLLYNVDRKESSYSSNAISFDESVNSTTLNITNSPVNVLDSSESCKVVHSTSPDVLPVRESSAIVEDGGEPEDSAEDQEGSTGIEEGYVIVQKQDVDNSGCLNEKESVSSSGLSPVSSNEDSNLCCNITEYLEVYVGKTKDEVYQFNFKANPESPVTSSQVFSGGTTTQNELKISFSLKDDHINSFKQMSDRLCKGPFLEKQEITNLTENKNNSDDFKEGYK